MAETADTGPDDLQTTQTRSAGQRVVAVVTTGLVALGVLRHPYGADARRVAPRHVLWVGLALLLAYGVRVGL